MAPDLFCFLKISYTSKYNLHNDENYTNALYAINLKNPLFYRKFLNFLGLFDGKV